MASRKEEKERLRRERLEEERRIEREQRRARRLRIAAAVAAVAVVAAVLALVRPWEQSSSESFAYDQEGLAERIADAGLREGGSEHVHPKLAVRVREKEIAVPPNMGIGAGHAPMHTHDPDGVMHVEGEPDPTLREFMAMWGVRLTPRELGPHTSNDSERVRMWVQKPGAKRFEEVPVQPDLKLEDRQQIQLYFGPDDQAPIT